MIRSTTPVAVIDEGVAFTPDKWLALQLRGMANNAEKPTSEWCAGDYIPLALLAPEFHTLPEPHTRAGVHVDGFDIQVAIMDYGVVVIINMFRIAKGKR